MKNKLLDKIDIAIITADELFQKTEEILKELNDIKKEAEKIKPSRA